MAMKLDTALKLYIVLYVLCFALTWFISVPMLIHVAPDNECLLFVTPYMRYGSAATCYIMGLTPIFVAVCALVMIVLHIMQLKSLKAFLSRPGPWRSADYERPPHIYWRMVVFHGIVTIIMVTITSILTAGYVDTCQNLYREVKTTIRGRFEVGKWGGSKGTNELYDRFANDHSIERYVNDRTDPWGRSASERSITCRSILTDYEIHYQLKLNQLNDPYNNAYIGPYSEHERGLADIRHTTIRDNLILELCLAGCWISTVLWLIILILMLFMRHHLRARLADESVWGGSEFGGSRRGGSRMSGNDFDKMSQSRYSQFSGSDMSSARRGRGHRSGSQPPPSENGYPGHQDSLQGLPFQAPDRAAPIYHRQASNPQQQKNLLSYFVENQPSEDEVDIDAALGDYPPHDDDMINPPIDEFLPNESALDTSFEFPIDPDEKADPIPMGDAVSSGTMRHIPIHLNQDSYHSAPSPRTPVTPSSSHHAPRSQRGQPQFLVNRPQDPTRVVGRRGARGGSGGLSPTSRFAPRNSASNQSMNSFQDHSRGGYPANYNDQSMMDQEQYDLNGPEGYRTRLGNSSMI